MAPFSFHIFVLNIEGKGVTIIFRFQVFIYKRQKKSQLHEIITFIGKFSA